VAFCADGPSISLLHRPMIWRKDLRHQYRQAHMHDKERHNGEPAIRRATSLAASVTSQVRNASAP